MSGFGVHLKYEVTKAPRMGDRVLMEMVMEVYKDESKLMSFSRVRGFLEAINLSDITTIDGQYLEEWTIKKGNYEKRSSYKISKRATKQQ